ncbi:RNA-binding domain-containing protein [Desarmillaria tabescens]|uniref:RNA-binding domain-containing protein n=1 Tax=Armillaria tabescens TaxID=1929756 RepID=A0AA39KEN4_ARMTA|nr:RNA-binding domain-containing protein [Desarmillaria tabescens]KAK0459772.1 RNA-binding domain-containing protein [Desarmillaria tabescens]
MEEGTKSKKTVFVGGIAEDVDETMIYEHFSTFGDIIEVQLPSAVTNLNQQSEAKHRGFAFVTYGSSADAQDAIDNMDMNEMHGKVIKVNLARPMKTPMQLGGNRAVWESEEWLKEHAKPLAESGGVQGRTTQRDRAESEDANEDAMQE